MAKSNIPAKVLTELNHQLNHELNAAQAYLALSVWCEARNLKGFAGFFAKQAGEERQHAAKMMKYLLDRAVMPQLAATAGPKQDFGALLEVVKHAQAMEQANTKGIHAVYESAIAAKDYPTQVLMHSFINEQVEEEAWAAEIVGRVQSATCAGSFMDLDRHIEKILAAGE